MEIGTIIRNLRAERGLTQEQLAEQIGVTFQAVSKWENGAGLPDISQIVPLARAFGVSTDVLFDTAEPRDDAARLAEYRERKRELVGTENFKATEKQVLELVREMAREFPRDFDTQRELAARLVHDDEEKPENFREALAIVDKLLAECGDERILREANSLRAYALGGIDGREAAFAEANKLPNLNHTRENVIMNLINGECEKETVVPRDLERLRDCIRGFWWKLFTATRLIRQVEEQTGVENGDERLAMLCLEESMARLNIAWDDGIEDGADVFWGRGERAAHETTLAMLQFRFAEYYAGRDVPKALDYLENGIALLINSGGEYSLQASPDAEFESVDARAFLRVILTNPDGFLRLNPLRGEPRFVTAVEGLGD